MNAGVFIGIVISIILIGGIIALVLTVHLRIYKHFHYVCLKCSNSYKPTTFLESLFGFNGWDKRKLKCPYCNKREWAEMKKDDI